ncbi:hypothetical protein AO726_08225 [Pseudomonas sp. TTU2014-080ASC]|nr:hypothetical protein AO726_08225 [Pseudomonas sp. TTU2014-080ASC]
MVATIIHHGVHGHLFKNKITNKIICEILSTAFIVQPYEPYRRFHVYEHHGKDFASFKDKDLSAIYKLGFTPGKTRQQLYKNLFKLLLSPTFHISYFKGRVTSNLTGIQPYRIAMSLIWMSFLLTTLTIYGALPFTLVVIIPFVIIYQMASLLHLITEHTWLLRPADKTVRDSHIENCLARFCGSLCPNDFSSKNIWPWIKWGVAHIFYHLPCRMLIVQGSLVCHDWHHRFGSVREWYNYSTLREIDVHKQVSKSTYKYIDIWGFKNCLDYVFGKISEAPITNTQNFEYRLN